MMLVTRGWLYAGQVSEPGTRLGNIALTNVTGGWATAVVASFPVWVIESSHSDGLLESHGLGKECARAYVSTALYPLAVLTRVWICCSITVLKYEIDPLLHVPVDPQIWSNGVSGQSFAVVAFRLT